MRVIGNSDRSLVRHRPLVQLLLPIFTVREHPVTLGEVPDAQPA